MTALAIALACAADAAFGDPAAWPHPVRIVGAACSRGERFAHAYARGDSRRELAAGAVLCASLVGGGGRFALEVKNLPATSGTQNLAEVEVAVDPLHG